jgi:hypothetical protein
MQAARLSVAMFSICLFAACSATSHVMTGRGLAIYVPMPSQ